MRDALGNHLSEFEDSRRVSTSNIGISMTFGGAEDRVQDVDCLYGHIFTRPWALGLWQVYSRHE